MNSQVLVSVRKRPTFRDDIIRVNDDKVEIYERKTRYDDKTYTKVHSFDFDHIFSENYLNTDLYKTLIKPQLPNFFKGNMSSVCYAYGQTGSGKTHTVFGGEEENGLIMLTACDIIKKLSKNEFVCVSAFEIYNNNIFDLLNKKKKLKINEDCNGMNVISGIFIRDIFTIEDLNKCMNLIIRRRNVGISSKNNRSSRSHAVFTIRLVDRITRACKSRIIFVDLAGSERASDSLYINKKVYRENIEINKSLLALKECIKALVEKRKHIPYRSSKLTRVLKDAFMTNSHTVMIGTVAPESDNINDTMNTLLYATGVKYIKMVGSKLPTIKSIAKYNSKYVAKIPRPPYEKPNSTKKIKKEPLPIINSNIERLIKLSEFEIKVYRRMDKQGIEDNIEIINDVMEDKKDILNKIISYLKLS